MGARASRDGARARGDDADDRVEGFVTVRARRDARRRASSRDVARANMNRFARARVARASRRD